MSSSFPASRLFTLLPLLLLLALSARVQGRPPTVFYSIDEELPAGTFVGDVSLHLSSPSPPHRRVSTSSRYSLVRASTDLFTIDEATGVIRTSKVIDSEHINRYDAPGCRRYAAECHITFGVKVVSDGDYNFLNVNVSVHNINDNSPVFSADTFSLLISESSPVGTLFDIPTAEDLDTDVLRYELERQDVFGLEVQDGLEQELRLRLLRPLDRELRDSYALRMTSHDDVIAPPRSSSLNISVTVGDENDNGPVMDRSEYNVSVDENLPIGTVLLTVHARDLDAGVNGKVRYTLQLQSLTAHGHVYGLDPETGALFVKSLIDCDSNRNKDVTLIVVATDGGLNPQLDHAKISIRINDVNDNEPIILLNEVNKYVGQVTENSPVDTVVMLVRVRDLDEGVNGQVTCVLDTPRFKLESTGVSRSEKNSYKLITAAVLDREQRASEQITISCVDHGSPPLTSNRTVQINVLDVNDHAPLVVSSDPIRLTIYETDQSSDLAVVTAKDPDAGENGTIAYSLRSLDGVGDVQGITIDASGVIRRTIAWDYENQQSYRCNVIVSDGGRPPRSSTVPLVILILDVDDNIPTFESRVYSFSIPYDKPVRSFVGKVHALDEDHSMQFSDVRYALVTSSIDIEVDQLTGVITNLVVFGSETFLQFKVRACNVDDVEAMRCDVTDVSISVNDVANKDPTLADEPPSLLYDGSDDVDRNSSVGGLGSLARENLIEFAVFSSVNIIVLVAVGCAVLGITILVVTLAVCVAITRNKQTRKRRSHKYNCRLETERAVSSLSLDGGGKSKLPEGFIVNDATLENGSVVGDTKSNSFDTFGVAKYKKKNKKGVTFHLDDKMNIGAPITDNKLSCPVTSVFARCAEESWYGKSLGTVNEDQWYKSVDNLEPRYVTVKHPRCFSDSKLNVATSSVAASPKNGYTISPKNKNDYMTSPTKRGEGSGFEGNVIDIKEDKGVANCLPASEPVAVKLYGGYGRSPSESGTRSSRTNSGRGTSEGDDDAFQSYSPSVGGMTSHLRTPLLLVGSASQQSKLGALESNV